MKILKTLIVVLIAISFGIILGYYYKKPDAMMLRVVSSQETEWKKDLLIESLRADTKLFELNALKPFIGEDGNQYFIDNGSFLFNWLAFSTSIIIMLLVYLFVTRTRIVSILKSKFKPYLK